MTMFPDPGPRLFAIPPGVSFAESFAAGYLARAADARPEEAARVRLLVNTVRALRDIAEALADAAPGPTVLPVLECLGDLGADPLVRPDLPPAEPGIVRQLRLTRQVEDFLARENALAPPAAAPALAEALARLQDELADTGLAQDALDAAAEGDFAAHWERTLVFLRGAGGGEAPCARSRQREAVEALVSEWRAAPPGTPVIAAGSTGSVGSTAELLEGIARLPQGAVVLPGFDAGIDPSIWENLTADHPMAPFAPLLARLGMAPADVRPWREAAHPAPARLALLTQALRPAPVTDAWQSARGELAAIAPGATAQLSLIEADSPRREAAAIALTVRAAIEAPERTVAVVTPDAGLARRITAELARFEIVPDDSLGQPLETAPAGAFLRMVLAAPEGGPVAAIALLKHPMARISGDRAAHLAAARRYEMALRAAGPQPPALLPPWPDADAGDAAWHAAAMAALAPLAGALRAGAPLPELVGHHGAAAEALSAGTVWQGEDGIAAARRMEEIARHAPAHGPGRVPDYPGLFRRLLGGAQLRPRPNERHPRVAIWGPAEARIRRADVMILAGLNDGTWPALPAADPWLSRPMRAAAGLTEPERQVGLSAHDFMGAAAAGEVILTRATRAEGAPTVPSRWLTRIANLLGGTAPDALGAMRARGRGWLDLLAHTHHPAADIPRAPRAAPRPPAEARPMALPITGVEELVRDPYATYARHVLKLAPLEALGRRADARERGTLLHDLMERFIGATMPDWPGDPDPLFDRLAADILAGARIETSQRLLWRGRIARFRDAFLKRETERRQLGTPVLLEARAKAALPTPAGDFILRGRIDRIDRLDGGDFALYDYKSGQLPGKNEVGLFALQLHLGAVLLQAGGVQDLGPGEPGEAAYLGLTADAPARYLEPGDGDVPAAARRAQHELAELIAAYADPARPYISRLRCQREGEPRDFDHLARRAEWEDGA